MARHTLKLDDVSAAAFLQLSVEVKDALEGDSNDAEHDALVSVAQFFGIEYDPEAAS
jgi:hypothetical protein